MHSDEPVGVEPAVAAIELVLREALARADSAEDPAWRAVYTSRVIDVLTQYRMELTARRASAVQRLLLEGARVTDVARLLGVSKALVDQIHRKAQGLNWRQSRYRSDGES